MNKILFFLFIFVLLHETNAQERNIKEFKQGKLEYFPINESIIILNAQLQNDTLIWATATNLQTESQYMTRIVYKAGIWEIDNKYTTEEFTALAGITGDSVFYSLAVPGRGRGIYCSRTPIIKTPFKIIRDYVVIDKNTNLITMKSNAKFQLYTVDSKKNKKKIKFEIFDEYEILNLFFKDNILYFDIIDETGNIQLWYIENTSNGWSIPELIEIMKGYNSLSFSENKMAASDSTGLSIWEKKKKTVNEPDSVITQKDTLKEDVIQKDSTVVLQNKYNEKDSLITDEYEKKLPEYIFYDNNMVKLDEEKVLNIIKYSIRKYVQVGLYRQKPLHFSTVIPKYRNRVKRKKMLFEERRAYYYFIDFKTFSEGEKILLYTITQLKQIDNPFIRIKTSDGSQYRIQWINGKKFFFVEITGSDNF